MNDDLDPTRGFIFAIGVMIPFWAVVVVAVMAVIT